MSRPVGVDRTSINYHFWLSHYPPCVVYLYLMSARTFPTIMGGSYRRAEINGGDYPADLADEVIEVRPNCREALAASLTLQKFVANMDDPFARRLLEALLANFGHQTLFEESNALRPSQITDYFTYSPS